MALEHHAQLDLDSWTLIPHPFNFMEKTYFQITANKSSESPDPCVRLTGSVVTTTISILMWKFEIFQLFFSILL